MLDAPPIPRLVWEGILPALPSGRPATVARPQPADRPNRGSPLVDPARTNPEALELPGPGAGLDPRPGRRRGRGGLDADPPRGRAGADRAGRPVGTPAG